MNCAHIKKLLGRIKKNKRNLHSAKKLTSFLMIYFKARLVSGRNSWPEEFTVFLESITMGDMDTDEKFCMLSDPRTILDFLINSEILQLSSSKKIAIFKSSCCDSNASHDHNCDKFWEEFLYYLKEFILSSTHNQNDFGNELFSSDSQYF